MKYLAGSIDETIIEHPSTHYMIQFWCSLTFEVGLSLQHFFPFPFASCDNCLRFILVSGAAVVGAELFTTIQSSSMWVGGVVVNNSLDLPIVGLLILSHLVGGVVDSSCGWFSLNMSDSSCGWSSEDSVVRGVVDSGCGWSSDKMGDSSCGWSSKTGVTQLWGEWLIQAAAGPLTTGVTQAVADPLKMGMTQL